MQKINSLEALPTRRSALGSVGLGIVGAIAGLFGLPTRSKAGEHVCFPPSTSLYEFLPSPVDHGAAISLTWQRLAWWEAKPGMTLIATGRSEEHTSELQSHSF